MAPLYMNPAEAGAADDDLRFNAIFRKQWISIPGDMNYWTVSVDKYVPSLGGGLGLMATSSYEGFIRGTNLAAQYSYEICNDIWELRLGLQAGLGNRRLDYSHLIFNDQIDNTGIIQGSVSDADVVINNSRYFLDAGVGSLFFYKNMFKIGVSANHINQPDESFTGGTESKLPVRWNVAARAFFEENNWYVVPGAAYYKQAGNTSWSLGCEVKSHYVSLGTWYRGNVNFQGSNAIVVTLTLDNFLGRGEGDNKFRVGFSHDATTGSLPFTRTSGSAEGAVEYQILTHADLSSENRCRQGYSDRGSMKCYGGFN